MKSCPVCSSRLTTRFWYMAGSRTGRIHPLFFCFKCYTIFHRAGYKEDDQQLQADLQWHLDKQEGHLSHAEWIVKTAVEAKPDAKTILDIGCGIGTTLQVAERHGLKALGMEPNRYAAEYATRQLNLNVTRGFYRSTLFPEKFDIIVLDNVLEHVETPRELFADVCAGLVPGGVLYLAVPLPNIAGRKKLLLDFLRPGSEDSVFKDGEVHINHFSFKGILMLTAENQCRILSANNMGQYFVVRNAG